MDQVLTPNDYLACIIHKKWIKIYKHKNYLSEYFCSPLAHHLLRWLQLAVFIYSFALPPPS
jgi:hypothetical protein